MVGFSFLFLFFFFKQKTAYEMRISDWSSDVCSSDLSPALFMALGARLYTSLGLANRVGPPFSTVVTNVPGPTVPIYSSGARLESIMGLLCLTDGLGLGHVVQSYCQEATITFTACRQFMPAPAF